MQVYNHTDGQTLVAAAFTILSRNIPAAVLFTLLTATSIAGQSYFDGEYAWLFLVFIPLDVIAWSVLAAALISTVLTGAAGFEGLSVGRIFGVFWRDLAMQIATLIAAMVVVFVLYVIWKIVTTSFTGNAIDTDAAEAAGLSWLVQFGLVLLDVAYTFLVYGFLGTWLIAAVVGGGRGLSAAFERGGNTFEETFVRMLLVSGPFAVLVAISYATGGEKLLHVDGSLDYQFVAGTVVGAGLEAIVIATMIVILSRVYLANPSGKPMAV